MGWIVNYIFPSQQAAILIIKLPKSHINITDKYNELLLLKFTLLAAAGILSCSHFIWRQHEEVHILTEFCSNALQLYEQGEASS